MAQRKPARRGSGRELAARKIRILTDLNLPQWRRPIKAVEDLFCPALHGLPEEHAAFLALLPIHDANGLLLNAIRKAGAWPSHGWACVFPADPFRTPLDLLTALKQRGVTQICCYPSPAFFGGAMATTLDSFDLGRKAEARMTDLAIGLGLKPLALAHSR